MIKDKTVEVRNQISSHAPMDRERLLLELLRARAKASGAGHLSCEKLFRSDIRQAISQLPMQHITAL